MYTVLTTSMPWLFKTIALSPLVTQNAAYPYAPTDGTVPCIIPLNGTPAGQQIILTYLSGLVNGYGPAGSGTTAPSNAPLSNVPYFSQQCVGAWTDSSGNVISVVSLQSTSPTTLTIPVGATQLQLGVNWGGGASFNSGSGGAWNFGVTGVTPGGGPPGQNTGKLIMNEIVVTGVSPLTTSGGLTDESHRLHYGEGPHGLGGKETTAFHSMLKQRATAEIAVSVPAGDSWLPQKGWQVYLYDVTANDQDCVFSGTIETIQTSWWGSNGDRLLSLSCVSFRQVLDSIRVFPGRLYQQQTAGYIFSDLLTLAAGSPIVAGNISTGPTIDILLFDGLPTIADCFNKLCAIEAVQFVWDIAPGTNIISFGPPGLFPSPFTIQKPDVLFECFDLISTRTDFRDRQAISIDFGAFGNSNDVFVGADQKSFALRTPAHEVVAAFITKNTQNTATGTFTGQPAAGDQVTVNYPSSGSIYNWAASSPYYVGQVIVDPNGHLQRVVTASTPGGYSVPNAAPSGGSMPTWNDLGGLTNDGTYLQWQDMGATGLGGPYQATTYTFVNSLDNTQWGQVLIGSSAAQTCQNLVDAINSAFPYSVNVTLSPLVAAGRGAGYGFSLPTWENPLVSADQPSGLSFTIRNQNPGQGYIATIGASSTAFSWSGVQTSGGVLSIAFDGSQLRLTGPAESVFNGAIDIDKLVFSLALNR